MSEQQQPQQDLGPELNINLHVAEINFVLAALAKAPFEQVEGLIAKIRAQGQMGFMVHQQAQAKAAEQAEVETTGETK